MDYELEYKRLIAYLEQQKEFYKDECRKGRLQTKTVVENRYKYDIFNKLCITTDHLKGECKMKPVIEENTKEFIRSLVANNGRGYAEDEVMDNLFEIGAYYSWGEENYGKHCRDNTVHGFLSVLKALLEESK